MELNGGGTGWRSARERDALGGRRRGDVLLTAPVSIFLTLSYTVKPVVVVGVALSQVTLMWLLHRVRLRKALPEHGEALWPFST